MPLRLRTRPSAVSQTAPQPINEASVIMTFLLTTLPTETPRSYMVLSSQRGLCASHHNVQLATLASSYAEVPAGTRPLQLPSVPVTSENTSERLISWLEYGEGSEHAPETGGSHYT